MYVWCPRCFQNCAVNLSLLLSLLSFTMKTPTVILFVLFVIGKNLIITQSLISPECLKLMSLTQSSFLSPSPPLLASHPLYRAIEQNMASTERSDDWGGGHTTLYHCSSVLWHNQVFCDTSNYSVTHASVPWYIKLIRVTGTVAAGPWLDLTISII